MALSQIDRPLFALVALLLVGGCASSESAKKEDPPAAAEAGPSSPSEVRTHGQGMPQGHPKAPPEAGSVFAGVVVETMDAAGYTYMKVNLDNGEARWAAAEATEVKQGDRVTLRTDVRMQNFTSKTLNRTFDSIYFVHVEEIAPSGQPAMGDTI